MFPVICALLLVLLAQGPLASDSLPAKAYSDGGPLSLSQQDIEILERLAQEKIKKHSLHEEPEEDVEIDLEPLEGPERPDWNGPKETLQEKPVKKGEQEFISLVDPSPKGGARQINVPVVEVKRRPAGQNIFSDPEDEKFENFGDTLFVAVTTACSVAAVFGLVAAGFCYFKLHKQHAAAADAAYPHYGGVGPSIGKKSPTQSGDASLAYSAQLHHFNQTKQKILSSEQPGSERGGHESEDSEGEAEEADYSVYECPGLAPTGDIEVANPLFAGSSPQSKDAPRKVEEE